MSDNSRQYRKRQEQLVSAVQLDLETDGFTYQKWGSKQRCNSGDWLVRSDDDCYTIARDSFENTYTEVSPGRFVKHATVSATQAEEDGSIKTREGETHYKAGDYLVDNSDDGSDCYAVSKERFEKLYQRIDG